MNLINKAIQPLVRRLIKSEFDFSNLDEYEFDVEGEFDVYNIESTLPHIDWDAIEAQLNSSEEDEDWKRRADREEIRRKLAMGTDDDVQNEVNLKKQSLQTRLQNGKNLQICFMNETASDCESQCSDTESTQDKGDDSHILAKESFDKLKANPQTFAAERARLQSEARLALAQAKEMARMQMKIEKRCQLKSPISEIVRGSFNKIGFPFPANKRRMSRQLITEMNIAQLQVIVNDLHNEVEKYNEELVQLLLMRDDLHMEQDSMLVDIEDLTNHLSAKENSVGTGKKLYPETSSKIEANSTIKNSFTAKAVKLKSLVKK